ncbi:MAG: hypothetical protein LQ337_002889 [Flavoplaca oasis]|nr:MAG: hypothetical protein LQ337_002889 [Flavoplaca oasis]
MSNSAEKPEVVPAALALLAIYNPSLSQNDDTVGEQIVYYYTKSNAHGLHRRKSHTPNVVDQEQKNEELRQIGLAQGMVQFARTFSGGEAVDSIQTNKSRVLLRELETGWWLLASVDLTRIITMSEPETSNSPSQDTSKTDIEYSAREVSPTALLLEQVMQAHQVFLLHHAQTLTELLARLQRPKFCAILERFWDDFVGKWDVLLHGNPVTDLLGGLKLAAGGELGIGVGEEEWGSGEREVLEGFIRRTDGLMDLIVSRFGESAVVLGPDEATVPGKMRQPPLRPIDWHLGQDPQPSDGVIFSGIGAIARASAKQVSRWVESLFKYGEGAYGVRENPVAVNRRRPNRSSPPSRGQSSLRYAATKATMRRSTDSANFGIPAPIVGKHKKSRDQQQQTPSSLTVRDEGGKLQPASTTTKGGNAFKTDTLMKYMTLGIYGSGVSASLMGSSGQPPNHKSTEVGRSGKSLTTSSGYFLVGLHGDLDEETGSDDNAQDIDSATGRGIVEGKKKAQSSRIAVRTLVVEQARKESMEPVGKESRDSKAADTSSYCRLRVVVYVNRPFIFTFLFELQTDGLAMPSFYRSLHHQLGPLQRPLLKSTSPSRVSERVSAASAPKSTVTTRNAQPIYDLVYDPYNITVHTTIPNIPEPGSTPQSTATGQTSWTRVEALSVHSQMLNTYSSTRGHESEVERTCKNNRGWWVVWMRLPHVAASQQLGYMVYREAFLLRKANDIGAAISKTGGGIWGRSTSDSSAGNGGASSRLAEGIGIDARQYIEGLVGLNR